MGDVLINNFGKPKIKCHKNDFLSFWKLSSISLRSISLNLQILRTVSINVFSKYPIVFTSFFLRSEYGAFWKCVTAGFIYMITQLAKMLFLATVFPVPVEDDDSDDLNAEVPFDLLTVSFYKYFKFVNFISKFWARSFIRVSKSAY